MKSIGSPLPRDSYSISTPFTVAVSISFSLEQHLPDGIQRFYAHQLTPVARAYTPLARGGKQAAAKSHLARLAHARLRLMDRPHLTREPDFADQQRARLDRPIEEARRDRGDRAEIRRGLVDREASGDVEKDVLPGEVKSDLLLENGDEQRQAVGIDPERRPARSTEGARSDQRLELDEYGPRALDRRHHDRAGDADGSLGEEELRGIDDGREAVVLHLEDADLVGRAETVLHGAQHAERVTAVALEIGRASCRARLK